MKKPRITDFDPHAKMPSLKSSLDHMPTIQKPESHNHEPTHKVISPMASAQKDDKLSITPSTPATNTAKSTKRPLVRRTFDLYEDQIRYLTRESLQERLGGNDISMNAMIREAVDNWIKKRTTEK